MCNACPYLYSGNEAKQQPKIIDMTIYTITKRGAEVTIRETLPTGSTYVETVYTEEQGAASVHLMTQDGVPFAVHHATDGAVLAKGGHLTQYSVDLNSLVKVAQRGGYGAIAALWKQD